MKDIISIKFYQIVYYVRFTTLHHTTNGSFLIMDIPFAYIFNIHILFVINIIINHFFIYLHIIFIYTIYLLKLIPMYIIYLKHIDF